jgi:hypothetical protein
MTRIPVGARGELGGGVGAAAPPYPPQYPPPKTNELVIPSRKRGKLFSELFTAVLNKRRLLVAMVGVLTNHHLRWLVLDALHPLNKHATPMALDFVIIIISIDMAYLRHLRNISCLRHFTPMGLVRRGRCPHRPLNTYLWLIPRD